MHGAKPLLSIVIPTRNRLKYAAASIRNVLGMSSPLVELVVQDNSDNDETERFVRDFVSDPRLKYAHAHERLDMVRNFDLGAARANGEYMCFIGDDDGVNPEILSVAFWAQANDVDAVVTTKPALYYWPDFRSLYQGDRLAGTLCLRAFGGGAVAVNPEAEMRKCARSAGQDFSRLPTVYYGFARRKCAEKVRDWTGTYFPGPSPDLAGALGVSNFARKAYCVDYPVFVVGSSGDSGAGLGAMRRHQGRLQDWPHLPKERIAGWSEIVPAFFSIATVWGEDTVQALRALGRDDLLSEFNIPLLHARCASQNPAFLKETLRSLFRALRVANQSYTFGMLRFLYGCCYTWLHRMQSVAKTRLLDPAGSVRLTGLTNICEAAESLTVYLNEHGMRFNPGPLDEREH